MSDNQMFGAYARLIYDLRTDACAMQKYNMDGSAFTSAQTVKPGAVPTLLFQMVDEGYTVHREHKQGSVVTILALSHDWMEAMRLKYEPLMEVRS